MKIPTKEVRQQRREEVEAYCRKRAAEEARKPPMTFSELLEKVAKNHPWLGASKQ